MLKKLQKKPLSTRKKILITAVSAGAILIFPFWILSFQQTVQQANQEDTLNQPTVNTKQGLEELKREFTAALKEVSKTFDQIQNLTKPQQNHKSTKSKLPVSEENNNNNNNIGSDY